MSVTCCHWTANKICLCRQIPAISYSSIDWIPISDEACKTQPPLQHSKTGEKISPQDVYHEFDSDVADKYRIMKFKTKVRGSSAAVEIFARLRSRSVMFLLFARVQIVAKKYVFGAKDVPHQAQYLQISYPAEYGHLPTDLKGAEWVCRCSSRNNRAFSSRSFKFCPFFVRPLEDGKRSSLSFSSVEKSGQIFFSFC